MCCEISTKFKGELFGEKNNLEKKVSQCQETERGALWGFSTSILSQNIKKLKWGNFFYFPKQNFTVPKKNWKGGPFGIFQHPFWHKTAKQLKGGPFGEKIFRKKVSQCRKKWKEGPFGLARYVIIHGKTFLVQFATPNGAIWCNNIL